MLYPSRRSLPVSRLLESLERRQLLSATFKLVESHDHQHGGEDDPIILVRSDAWRSKEIVATGSTGAGGTGSTTQSISSSFNITINPAAGLASNAAALAAFERAAELWEARISDPINVTIDADLSNIGSSSIIGQTGSVTLQGSYADIRNAMVTDGADEADDGIVSSLPSGATFITPAGITYDGTISSTKANLKALGFPDLDTEFGAADGQITFNSQFSFDYDNSDGITPGTMDFETVAAHEIGHALGFVSGVDEVDYYQYYGIQTSVSAQPLDLFRFENNIAGRDPSTTEEFGLFPRSLRGGIDAITDDIDGWQTASAENRMSTGSGRGDGRQASHWKDGDITGTSIGLMDPTLGYSQYVPISDADWRALDLIGWDIAEPNVEVLPPDDTVPPPSAPTAANDSASTNEDTVINATAPGVLANDSDPNGGSVTAVAFTGTTAKGAQVTLNADGSYTYDSRTASTIQALNSGQSTTDTFSYTVKNTAGLSATATVTINISGVTDIVPPAAPTTATTTSDGSTSRLTIKWLDKSNNETGFRIQRSKVSDFSSGVSTFTVGANVQQFNDSNLSANTTYYYRIRAYNSAYESSAASTSGRTKAPYVITTAGRGLTGKYYWSSSFSSLKVTRTDATVNFNWGSGKPVTSQPSDNFTIRWTGQVLPTYDEAYTFYGKMNDNVRVWIDDPTDSAAPQLIIRRWGSSNSNEYKSSPIALKAGRKYNIQIDMRERTGNASAVLSWSSASVSKRVIPQSQLYTYASGAPATYVDPSGESSSPTIGTTTGVTAALTAGGSNNAVRAISILSDSTNRSANDYLLGILR